MSSDTSHPILQACAVPYRRRGDRLEFCLITSIRKGTWQFPKGIIDPGETPIETALKEAEEEAGLHGHVFDGPLGGYEYAKWGTTLAVTAFLMEVEAADDHWEEANLRRRCWCGAEGARRILGRDELRRMLDAALARLAP